MQTLWGQTKRQIKKSCKVALKQITLQGQRGTQHKKKQKTYKYKIHNEFNKKRNRKNITFYLFVLN